MWFQHGRNPYLRSCSREGIGQDGTRKDKSSKGVENTDQSQGCGKLPWICKFLLMIHSKLQPYCKTTEWTKGKEGLEIGGRTSKGIWGT